MAKGPGLPRGPFLFGLRDCTPSRSVPILGQLRNSPRYVYPSPVRVISGHSTGSLGMSAFGPKADLMKRKAVLGVRFGSTFKQSAQDVRFVRSTEKNR